MKKEEIQHLANLSRLELTNEEQDKYAGQFGEILHYVGKISEMSKQQTANSEDVKIENTMNRNIFREDDDVQEGGIYSEKILSEAPDTKDDFVKVKQILKK